VPASARTVGESHAEPCPPARGPGVPRRDFPHAAAPRPQSAVRNSQSPIMLSSLNALVPMLCVTAAAIAAMTAEAFRAPGERIPIGPLGVIGLVGAGVACVALWGHNSTSFGVVVADNFGLFVTWILILVGLLSLAVSG